MPTTQCVCGQSKQKRSKVCGDCSGNQAKPAPASSLVATGNTAEITRSTNTNIRTLQDLIRVCEIDTTEWEVERWVANKWEVAAKDKGGTLRHSPLFQVKAWLRRKVVLADARAEISALFADALKKAPKRTTIKATPRGEHMLEIAIPDLHVGKLAWAAETGSSYDTKIARDLFHSAIDALIARTSAFKFNRILFPVGQDLLHSDSLEGTTTKGTRLDTDSRYQKSFMAARELMTEGIDRLLEIAPVDVEVIPGNHDQRSAWTLGHSLQCFYRNTSNVWINNEPTSRKYVQHGKVMILLTHGDKGKKQDYPLLMATERPKMFGETVHREVHTGHLHQTRVQEFHGVRVRISPALCSADAWHAENMFVGQVRGAEAYVWHPQDGLVTLALFTVPAAA